MFIIFLIVFSKATSNSIINLFGISLMLRYFSIKISFISVNILLQINPDLDDSGMKK